MSIEGIYIDDTGNPGEEALSVFLPESRKSWAAVVIPKIIAPQVEHAMNIFLEGIKKDFGADELHFTDIYSGRGVWKNIDVEERIKMFDLMTELVSGFNLPILYQSFSEEFRNDHKNYWDSLEKHKILPWNFKKVEHISFLLLVFRTKQILSDMRLSNNFSDEVFQVYSDEGIAKDGAELKLPFDFKAYLKESVIFKSSENSVGIQIADFAAFLISKSQRILMNKSAGNLFQRQDTHILSSVSKLNHWTLEIAEVDENQISKEGIEYLLMKARKESGLTIKPKNK